MAVALLVHELDGLAETVDEDVSAQVIRARRDVAHFGQAGMVRAAREFGGDVGER